MTSFVRDAANGSQTGHMRGGRDDGAVRGGGGDITPRCRAATTDGKVKKTTRQKGNKRRKADFGYVQTLQYAQRDSHITHTCRREDEKHVLITGVRP